jgi:putative alpha-1,2-mannosidase
MVGTFGDVIVADAMIKDIPGFDKASAVQAIRKDAFESPPAHAGGAVGKEGLQQYVSLGYVPHDNDGETVSRTLDFGFADMAVAEALHHASEDESFVQGDISLKEKLIEEANTLYERSKRAVTSLYNKDYGLMVPRRSNGGFALSRFDPAGWGNGFTEGSAWHHSFPPYSVDVLAGLHGGKQKLLNKLHEMFKVPSTFGVGSYGQVSDSS